MKKEKVLNLNLKKSVRLKNSNTSISLNNEASNKKYFDFFENAPIAFFIEDFSEVKLAVENKAKECNVSIETYLSNNPTAIRDLGSLASTKEVNHTATKLYKAKSKEYLLQHIDKVFTKNSIEDFSKLVLAILLGKQEVAIETVNKTFDGDIIDVLIKFKVDKNSKNTLKNVIVSIENITEHRREKELFKKNNKRLNDQFENSPLAAIVWDLDFNVVKWNSSAEQIFGYSKKEALGKNAFELIIPEKIIPKINEGWENLLSGKNGFRNTNKNKTKTGKIITCDWYNVPLKDSQNNIVAVFSLANDISEKILTKKRLKKSEKKYRNIFERTNDAVFLIKDEEIADCNQAAVKIFKYGSKNELLNIHPFKLAPEILPDGCESHIKAQEMMHIAFTKGVNRFRCHHITQNGIVFPTEVSMTRIDEDKDFPLLHLVIRDITNIVKQEVLEDVLYNISRAALTINGFKKFGYFIKDELQKIIDTSNFFIAIYNEATGMISTPVFVDEKEEVEEFSAKGSLTGYVIKTKKSLIINKEEHKKIIKEGVVNLIGLAAEKWLGVPLIIKDKVIGAIVVQSYTNEYAYNDNDVNLLEFVADQISTTIQRKKAENELNIALMKAKESDKLKSSFLANMSHEIRTPMNGIIGFSELFLSPGLTEKERENYAKIVINSSKQLLSIVNDILDISKIEAGAIKLNYESVNINKLLDDLFDFYHPKAQQNKLKLRCVKGVENLKSNIHIDRTKLNQVLTNLLSNSFKFTDQGSIEFGYELIGEYLQFFVKDTGSGIEEKLQNKIFDRFIQANSSLTKKHSGTGLGLAISKRFVELFKGKIWLNSNSNGTTIFFTIPFIKSPMQKVATVIEKQKPVSEVKNKEITILVAEDEEYNMMYINELFSKTNFTVFEASNGKKAVELVQAHPEIDLVLMDIKMPVMNGADAMKIIKKENSNLPVIALSAFAMESDKKNALSEGFNAYLTKPINKKLLFEVIDKFS